MIELSSNSDLQTHKSELASEQSLPCSPTAVETLDNLPQCGDQPSGVASQQPELIMKPAVEAIELMDDSKNSDDSLTGEEALENLRRKLAQKAKLFRITPPIGKGNAHEVWDMEGRVSLGAYDHHDAVVHKNRRPPLYACFPFFSLFLVIFLMTDSLFLIR